MKKDALPVHTGLKTVAVSSKKEAAKAADDLAKEQEAAKPPVVNPNLMPSAKPVKKVTVPRTAKAKRK